MHRLQATTADASGWYLAAATKGTFSVLIPLPFNDFSVADDDPAAGGVITHTVGAKSSEGIKFSATGAYVRCVKTPKSVIVLILEFPNVHAKAAEEFKTTFLSSLKIATP